MYNDSEIIDILIRQPQTIKTFLGNDNYKNSTEMHKIKKRLYRLCDSKKVGRGLLRGKNRGETVFYSFNKRYIIVVIDTICGIKHYYCKSISDLSFGEQILHKCYMHDDFSWKYIGDKSILRRNVLDYF